jgi:membrane dipeptidase
MTLPESTATSSLHERLIVIDGCSHSFAGWTEKLATSGATALNLTMAGAAEDFLGALEKIENTLQHIRRDAERLQLARTTDDITRAKQENRSAIVLNFQNGRPLSDRLGHLELFWELGVRNIQLTYNERNFIGDGCLEPTDAGLSRFGKEVIRRMNELGMVIDLSHAGERTSLEAIALSQQPTTFSHSNPRKRADNPRNITDEQIKACAAGGGVIGICGFGALCWTGGPTPPTVDDLIDHMEYVANLVGVDHVGIASDSTTVMSTDHMRAHASRIDAAYPTVMQSYIDMFGHDLSYRYPVPVQSLPQVTERLTERRWENADIEKVMGGNVLQLWQRVWGQG